MVEDLRKYAGKWIAEQDGTVIATADTCAELLDNLPTPTDPDGPRPTIWHLPPKDYIESAGFW